jgi:3'(2'), 5'-bisphosphate nucleotidase
MYNNLTHKDLQRWVLPLLELSAAAGEAICQHYYASASGDFEAKRDDSPLTLADLASHRLLSAGLHALDPAIPLLSEESAAGEIAQRHTWDRYWLVDPLDGTREFLERTGEFTINIALIDRHRPVLGVLYLPLERAAYIGIPGAGAQSYRLGADGRRETRELSTRRLRTGSTLRVMASRRHKGAQLEAHLAWLEQQWGPIGRENMGSALKFSRMASGEGDFYPRFSPCCEWDTAAGQAVLEAAGGCVVGLDGQPLRYNVGDSLYSPPFYAIADGDHPLWKKLLEAGPA